MLPQKDKTGFGQVCLQWSRRGELECRKWGCNKWGFKGCLASRPGNRPKSAFSPFCCLFRPFPEGTNSTCRIQRSEAKGLFRDRKISPKFFRPKFFRGRPRGMSVPKCLFSQNLEGPTEVFGRMSAGTSGQKLRSLGWFFVSDFSSDILRFP